MPFLNLDNDADTIQTRLRDGVPLIACLCAEWCGSCREYRDAFTALSDARPDLCFVWIDIEDQADVADGFNVENFPTIVIEDSGTTRFSGTVLPQRGILERLLSEFPALRGTGEAPQLRPLLLS